MRVAKVVYKNSVQDMLDFVTKCEKEGWKVVSIMKDTFTHDQLGFIRYSHYEIVYVAEDEVEADYEAKYALMHRDGEWARMAGSTSEDTYF